MIQLFCELEKVPTLESSQDQNYYVSVNTKMEGKTLEYIVFATHRNHLVFFGGIYFHGSNFSWLELPGNCIEQ